MRLTLRTLLAYMDDILDPEDQEVLTHKVESSEFATDLIHRTRDTVRRLGLGAPRVMGAGIGLDPNTVAEYLDNTLSADSVADFERVCLESDIHLAEVASCHHILTMVLGEPAEVDPDLRKRMYATLQAAEQKKHLRVEGPHQDGAAAQEAHDSSPTPAVPTRPPAEPQRAAAEIPDYLRTGNRSWLGRLGAVAAALMVLVVAGALVMQLSGWKPDQVASRVADEGESTPGDASAAAGEALPPVDLPPQPAAGATEPATAGEPAPGESAASGLNVDRPTDPSGPASASTAAAAVQPPPEAGSVSAGPDPSDTPMPQPTPPSATQPLAGPIEAPPRSAAADLPETGDFSPASGLPPARLPPPPADGPAEPVGTLPDGAPARTEPAVPGPGAAAATAPPAAAAPVARPDAPLDPEATFDSQLEDELAAEEMPSELGMYWDDRDLLLRHDGQKDTWIRLASRTPVEVGDQLLSLPTFRPNVSLHSGMGVNLSGATLVRLAAEPAVDTDVAAVGPTPRIELVYGRMIAVNTSGQESPLQLVVGDISVRVLLDRNATLALEVDRSHVPGRDPAQEPAPLKGVAYAPQGDLVWITPQTTTRIAAPSRWSIVDEQAPEVSSYSDPIDWLASEPTERLEERAAAEIRDQLQPGNRAGTALLELFYGSRRREVKSMAARCSVYVGEFGPFVDALRDSDQRSAWETHIQTLRSAMALSPASAERIRDALVRQRGEPAADDLYEMLRGYDRQEIGQTAQQRQQGAIEKLIGHLESDSLDYRVLAAHNLREITGKNLLPNPAGSPAERQQGVRRWRQRLKDGELQPVDSN